jgi:uncharacterized protein
MNEYITYELNNHKIYISQINGNQIILPNDPNITNKDLKRIFKKNHMDDEIPTQLIYKKEIFKTIYISLHASSKCNMNCKYCFMQDRPDMNITIDEAKRFIDFIISEFPEAEKFIVDPTGSGEPLLRIAFILELAKYCHLKSNEICKEVLPMLVTNGTLLTKENVDKLQSVGYIFGISIDGYKETHDANRVNKKQEGTYKQIIKNVKNIKHREYLGVAVTLTNEKMELVKTFKTLSKYFTTISIKPVRCFDNRVDGINENNIEEIKSQYTRLYKYILQKALKGKLDSLGILLNGDDYFGKFIQRVILNHKVSTRCDAGLGRFSLTPDKKIIACPGSIGIEDMELGTLDIGLDQERMSQYYKIQTERTHCQDCDARYVCGGECFVVAYYKNKRLDSVDEVMCKLKKHLFELAVKLKFNLILHSEELFNAVYEGCQVKANRFKEDKDLSQILQKLNKQYTFMELKKIKDDDFQKYSIIKGDFL